LKTQEKNRKKGYTKKFWDGVPATVRKSPLEDSLYNFLFKSVFGHIAGIILICFFVFLLNFLGITPKIKDNVMKVKDIAFTLAGPANKGSVSQNNQNQVSSEPANKLKTSSMPQTKSVTQKIKSSGVSDFEIPIPDFKSMSSGLSSSKTSRIHASGLEVSTNSVSAAGGSSSSDSSSTGGGGFNKVATKNLIVAYDISPYVNELKREVRWSWKIPPTAGGKRVELFLRIAKDGRLMILNVKRTSEIGAVDNAALDAVRKCMPLNPLPVKYNKSYLDLIFSFDSATNSIGSRY